MPRPRPARRLAASAAAALLLVSGAGACSDDGGGASSTSVAPESIRVPMSEVLAGLPRVVEHANSAAAAANTGDYTTALAEYEELHAIWLAIEGTIKATDQDAYLRMEDAQGLIKDGAEHDNGERVQEGADLQTDVAGAFLAAHSRAG